MKTLYATDLCQHAVLDYAKGKRARFAQYSGITDNHINAALCRAMRDGLQFELQSNVTRDRHGWLSKPSAPAEWPAATPCEAREILAQHIWCEAVRAHNVRRMT